MWKILQWPNPIIPRNKFGGLKKNFQFKKKKDKKNKKEIKKHKRKRKNGA